MLFDSLTGDCYHVDVLNKGESDENKDPVNCLLYTSDAADE